MKETNELLGGEATVSRPSKSGVAGSSPAGPTKNKGVSDDPLAPPTGAGEGRELLNVGKTLADTAAQIARLREMAEEVRDSHERCLRFAAQADEEGKVGSADVYRMTARVRADRLSALTAAADALEREGQATEYCLGMLPRQPDHWLNRVLVQRREGWMLPKQPYMWAVSWGGNVLAKDGSWEYEPIPSSRDDEFYGRCRFDTRDQAWSAALAAIDAMRGAK